MPVNSKKHFIVVYIYDTDTFSLGIAVNEERLKSVLRFATSQKI